VTERAADAVGRVVVRLESDGGFAYLPGLQRPVEVDSARLAPEEGARLRALLDAARFFSRPADDENESATSGPGAADQRTYTVTATRGGRTRTLRFSDPVGDPALARLVAHLESLR
jgi:hypothetical protein